MKRRGTPLPTKPDPSSAKAAPAGTSTLDLALRAVEYLVQQSRPAALAQIAEARWGPRRPRSTGIW
jgi:hypothetical protein